MTDTPATAPAGSGSDSELAIRLHSAILHLMRRIRREDAAFGLSAPRMSALSCVAFGTPRTLGELADMEQVSAPTMTRLVARLEDDGLVARRPDPADRRVVWISATPKGRRMIERGRSRRTAFLAARLAGLTAGERQALLAATAIMERMHGESR